ncbi:hypothetical protein [Streptomyces sp. NPDC060031]|uniref:hypothetical protein n=1 Tax=Streptomyces sp. NPDC060031 TaxID=3347043 RepID=UPI0036ADE640
MYAVTYLAVFLQAFFPLLLFRPFTRHVAFVLVALMHVGIGVLMGIPFFSLFMISTDLVLITDREYHSLGTWLRRKRQRPGDSRQQDDSRLKEGMSPT